MMNMFKDHLGHYISLITVFAVGLFFIVSLGDKQAQVLIAAFLTFFYVLWGIFHHLMHHDLSPKIVVEYVLIGSLGLSLILFLLKGGNLL